MEAPVTSSTPATPNTAPQPPPPQTIPDSLLHTQHNVTPNHIQLPKQLESVKAAQIFPLTRHRWNTNEEIASILIAFSRHADWQYHEVKVRPPSGCLLLFNRNAVRYRKDGYCWKKRKDGKTIREDHMKLKVQGLECIYGSYVHSAILPTFHRRCYWLLQNPDIVLVHYLNVPYPNNTKLSIPVMSFAMEKKEWTKQELIDQLTPMFSSLDGKRLSALDETILTLVQRLIENQDKHKQELRGGSKCPGGDCDPAHHSKLPGGGAGGGGDPAQLPIQPDTAKCAPGVTQDTPGVAGSASTVSTAILQQVKESGGRLEVGQGPLILNLGNLTTGQVMLVTGGGQNSGTHLSILTNTTSTSAGNQPGHQPGNQPGNQQQGNQHPGNQQQQAWGALPLSSQQVAQLSSLTGSGQAVQLSSLVQGGRQSGQGMVNGQGVSQDQINIQALQALNNSHASHGIIISQASPMNNQSSQGQINSHAHASQQPLINTQPSHGQVNVHTSQTNGPQLLQGQIQCSTQGQITLQASQGQMKQEGGNLTSSQPSCCMCSVSSSRHPPTPDGLARQQDLTKPLGLREAGPSGSCAMPSSVQQMETSSLVGSCEPSTESKIHRSLLESLCQDDGSSGNQAVDNLDTLVGDLNLELMAGYKELPGEDGSRRTIEHMGDSFESLQASLNLDHLDLLDIPELDKICTDISGSSAHHGDDSQSQVTQGCEGTSKGRVGVARETNACTTTDFAHLEMNSINANGLLLGQQGLGGSRHTYTGDVCKPGGVAVTSSQMSAAMTHTYQSSGGEAAGSGAIITDFCPDWTYTEGETKVLVTGPWHPSGGPYTILLDGKVLATTLVQQGVLRCFVPRHACGYVTLQVACEGRLVSNSVMFEYKERPISGQAQSDPQHDWFSVEACKLQDQLTGKLEHLDKALSKGPDSAGVRQILCNLVSGVDKDICLARHLEAGMCGRVWTTAAAAGDLAVENGSMGLSLLHLAAGLGYHRFIKALIRWRSEKPSWMLEYEVDAHSTDMNACTPLMWACARGHTNAVICLYKWNKGPLHSFNREGNLPLFVARQHGHHQLADTLEQLDRDCHLSSSSSSRYSQTASASGSHVQPSDNSHHHRQHAMCSDITAAASARSTPDKACFSSDFPIATSTPTTKDAQNLPADLFKSPQTRSKTEKSLGAPLHIDIPARESSPAHTISQQKRELTRRQSEQMLSLASTSATLTPATTALTAAERRQKLKKRLSVDILPYEKSEPVHYSPTRTFQRPIREANSEPHLSANMEHLLCESNPMLPQGRELGSPEMLMQTEGSDKLRQGSSNSAPSGAHIDRMDTDELSDSSGNSFVDVEKLSSDDEDLRSKLITTGEDGENPSSQMVHLAKQIIAAMPERIKSSPSRCDEAQPEESVRERSSSYGSLQSASPHASSSYGEALSSYGEDSGISTPMRDSLAFDEYRYSDVYSDLGTPASSLSPDSTCLHSPYSPYSFHLDSPPPTAAEFIEYFNAPATFMEKDFSQLTLSDLEQRKLYEAAKVIQSAYRQYKDKQCKQQKEIEAAILIQSYYRRYKQYAYYKKMTQAAVLIQSQFRSYYAQKRFKKSRDAAVVIQNQYRSYKEHERLKKGGNKTVIQRYRSHYQRKPAGSGKGSRVVQIVPDGSDASQVETANPVIEECPQDTSRDVTPPGGGSSDRDSQGQATVESSQD